MARRQRRFEFLPSSKQHLCFQGWCQASHATGCLPQICPKLANCNCHSVTHYLPWLQISLVKLMIFGSSVSWILSAIFNILLSYRAHNASATNSSIFTFCDKRLNFKISKLRFTFRSLSKRRRGAKTFKSKELRSSDKFFWKHDKPITLAIALSLELQLEQYGHPMRYDVLMLIASRLHYADIVSLSLASKALRQVIFPPYIRAAKSEMLRIQCCEDGTKTECWICRSQICRVGVLTIVHSKICRTDQLIFQYSRV